MPAIGIDMLAIGGIPHLRDRITSSIIDIPAFRRNALVIRSPGYPQHGVIMHVIGIDMPASRCIPARHRSVLTSRGDALAIRRPGHRIDTTSMPVIGIDMLASGGIPYLHRAIIACRGEALAIGRPAHPNY